MKIFEEFFDDIEIEIDDNNSIELDNNSDFDYYMNVIYHYNNYNYKNDDKESVATTAENIKKNIYASMLNIFDEVSEPEILFIAMYDETNDLFSLRGVLCAFCINIGFSGKTSAKQIDKFIAKIFHHKYTHIKPYAINISTHKENGRIPEFVIDEIDMQHMNNCKDKFDIIHHMVCYNKLNEDFFDDIDPKEIVDEENPLDNPIYSVFDLEMITSWSLSPVQQVDMEMTKSMAFRYAFMLNYLNDNLLADSDKVKIYYKYANVYADGSNEHPLYIDTEIPKHKKVETILFKFKMESRQITMKTFWKYIEKLTEIKYRCGKEYKYGDMSLMSRFVSPENQSLSVDLINHADHEDIERNKSYSFAYYSNFIDMMVKPSSILNYLHKNIPDSMIFRCRKIFGTHTTRAKLFDIKNLDLKSGDFKIRIFSLGIGNYPMLEIDKHKNIIQVKQSSNDISNSDVEMIIDKVSNYKGTVYALKEYMGYETDYIFVLANELIQVYTDSEHQIIPKNYHISVVFK